NITASNQPFPTFARRHDIPPSTAGDHARVFAPFAPNLIQPERIAAHQNYNFPYFRKKDSPLLSSKNETDNDGDAIVHFDNDIHNEKAWQEKPILLKRPNRSTRPYSNIPPTTTTTPSTHSNAIIAKEKPSPRMRRDEEQTLDVIAEPIYIQDVGEDEPDDSSTSNYHDITKDNIWTKQSYCTDKYGIYALSLSFALLALLALPSAIYTFHDIVFMRPRMRRDEEQTLDVIAEPIYIQDVGEDEPDDSSTSNYHDITKDNIWTKQSYCTDKYGIYALSLSFALLALLALPSAIYTFYDIVFMRSKRRKGLISANSHFGSSSINNLQNRIRPLNTEVNNQEMPFGIPRITPRQILNNRR
uniref:Uncharacterized protein n=1 Tax=Panagrolaimus sp. ES5 TaxID=591445 RepID=A0AC34G7Y5_9BILA